MSTVAVSDAEHPRQLIPELCRLFYTLGWVTGTGGGISMRLGNEIFVAPSGVQKERIQADDIFVIAECEDAECTEALPGGLDVKNAKLVSMPANTAIKKISECTPLFMNAYRMRNAGAVLHSHSQNSLLVSIMSQNRNATTGYDEFQISHIEMIKGIKRATTKTALGFRDTLVVPIIDNTDFEKDLTDSMAACMNAYPDTYAVIVRRHGIYVWGDTWQQAKGMVECLDYLFELSLKMRQHNLQLTPANQNEL